MRIISLTMEIDSSNFTVLEGKLLKYVNIWSRYKSRYVILKKLSFEYYYIESYKKKSKGNESEDYKYVLAKRYGIDEIFTRKSFNDNLSFEVSTGIGKDLIFTCNSEIERKKWIDAINNCKADYLISHYGSTRNKRLRFNPTETEENEIVCNTCQTIVTPTDDIICYCTNCKYDTSLRIDPNALTQKKIMLKEILDTIPKLRKVEIIPKPKIRRAQTLPAAFSELSHKLQVQLSVTTTTNKEEEITHRTGDNLRTYKESSVI